jgi:TPR repeat protein
MGAKYAKLAADQNHAPVQFECGHCLFEGRGFPTNLVQAAQYVQRSANHDHRHGQLYYGMCLLGCQGQ